jgi:hypothetical protein
MTPERIKHLRELLGKSTPAPSNVEALCFVLRHAKKVSDSWGHLDNDDQWFPDDRDAVLIAEMRASLEELLTIAEKPDRNGW